MGCWCSTANPPQQSNSAESPFTSSAGIAPARTSNVLGTAKSSFQLADQNLLLTLRSNRDLFDPSSIVDSGCSIPKEPSIPSGGTAPGQETSRQDQRPSTGFWQLPIIHSTNAGCTLQPRNGDFEDHAGQDLLADDPDGELVCGAASPAIDVPAAGADPGTLITGGDTARDSDVLDELGNDSDSNLLKSSQNLLQSVVPLLLSPSTAPATAAAQHTCIGGPQAIAGSGGGDDASNAAPQCFTPAAASLPRPGTAATATAAVPPFPHPGGTSESMQFTAFTTTTGGGGGGGGPAATAMGRRPAFIRGLTRDSFLMNNTTTGGNTACSGYMLRTGTGRGGEMVLQADANWLPFQMGNPLQVQIGELLGRGGCGSVYRGQWRGRPVAVKVVQQIVAPPAGAAAATAAAAAATSGGEACSAAAVPPPVITPLVDYFDSSDGRSQRDNVRNICTDDGDGTFAARAPYLPDAHASVKRLRHPNVLRTFAYAVLSAAPQLGGVLPARHEHHVVLELCDGGSLRDWLDQLLQAGGAGDCKECRTMTTQPVPAGRENQPDPPRPGGNGGGGMDADALAAARVAARNPFERAPAQACCTKRDTASGPKGEPILEERRHALILGLQQQQQQQHKLQHIAEEQQHIEPQPSGHVQLDPHRMEPPPPMQHDALPPMSQQPQQVTPPPPLQELQPRQQVLPPPLPPPSPAQLQQQHAAPPPAPACLVAAEDCSGTGSGGVKRLPAAAAAAGTSSGVSSGGEGAPALAEGLPSCTTVQCGPAFAAVDGDDAAPPAFAPLPAAVRQCSLAGGRESTSGTVSRRLPGLTPAQSEQLQLLGMDWVSDSQLGIELYCRQSAGGRVNGGGGGSEAGGVVASSMSDPSAGMEGVVGLDAGGCGGGDGEGGNVLLQRPSAPAPPLAAPTEVGELAADWVDATLRDSPNGSFCSGAASTMVRPESSSCVGFHAVQQHCVVLDDNLDDDDDDGGGGGGGGSLYNGSGGGGNAELFSELRLHHQGGRLGLVEEGSGEGRQSSMSRCGSAAATASSTAATTTPTDTTGMARVEGLSFRREPTDASTLSSSGAAAAATAASTAISSGVPPPPSPSQLPPPYTLRTTLPTEVSKEPLPSLVTWGRTTAAAAAAAAMPSRLGPISPAASNVAAGAAETWGALGAAAQLYGKESPQPQPLNGECDTSTVTTLLNRRAVGMVNSILRAAGVNVGIGGGALPVAAASTAPSPPPVDPMNPAQLRHLVTALDCLAEIASGLSYLHGVGMVHGDVKSGNLLLKLDPRHPRGFVLKLADFGFSRVLEHGSHTYLSRPSGTLAYLSPEMVTSYRQSAAADQYAFGLLVWEVVTTQPLFRGLKTPQMLYAKTHNADWQHLVWPTWCPEEVRSLARRCADHHPAARLTAVEAREQLEALRVHYQSLLSGGRSSSGGGAAGGAAGGVGGAAGGGC
ncbi:hypothetical protein VOLCADRAFT_118846 [Volvox carteri f. nagariensis]|uniref:Protein kinase domain-containing protein n=1 Tax=Volvox carteri f. nagariensis TaxID=3068 RepID=D8U818_VOLCA|nr:uncharacterized protein VOLCADRAFT_118846 [Volvox carteri f. nagariensis]EFJ44190.1 hypothetical protein VOLCADRAFT_118846 [Volvox carteri f. nagariensis]|eukprot:XP_002954784.1 hypothetical protein VOLCADRAFT_118846 [Volvox carteri f. nagariensis]